MKPTRFLGLAAVAYLGLIALFGSNTSTPPSTTITTVTPVILYAPVTTASTTTSTTTTASTTTTTTTLPQLVDYDTPCQEYVDEALAAGWPADRQIITKLLSVIWRESRCQPTIVSKSADHGLAQINEIHRAYAEQIWGEPFEQAMTDPVKNLNMAWRLFSEREARGLCGWQPWSLPC